MRRAIVIVMVEPPDNRGMLAEWQWPQASATVTAREEEETIIPAAVANEARVAAQRCLDLIRKAGESDGPVFRRHGYTCGICNWGRDGDQDRTYWDYLDHRVETGHDTRKAGEP